MEFYISPQSGQFYMINVLENQWLSVTYRKTGVLRINSCACQVCRKISFYQNGKHTLLGNKLSIMYLKAILMILGLFYRNCLNFSDNTGAGV